MDGAKCTTKNRPNKADVCCIRANLAACGEWSIFTICWTGKMTIRQNPNTADSLTLDREIVKILQAVSFATPPLLNCVHTSHPEASRNPNSSPVCKYAIQCRNCAQHHPYVCPFCKRPKEGFVGLATLRDVVRVS